MANYARLLSPNNNITFLCVRTFLANLPKFSSKVDSDLINDEILQKPKRPMSTFFKFVRDIRSEILKEHPDANAKLIIKLAAEKWQSIDPVKKGELQKAYTQEYADYVKQYAEYKSNVPDDIKYLEAKSQKKTSHYNSKLHALGKPKKPPNSYALYMQREGTHRSKNVPFKEWSHAVAEKWHQMEPEKKVVYEAEANRLMQEYYVTLQKWEDRMLAIGCEEVVRNKTMIIHKSKRQTE